VENIGTNPAVLWKHIRIDEITTAEGIEPKIPYPDDTIFTDYIVYDLEAGGSVIFEDADEVTLNDVQCMWMPIGVLPVDGSLHVLQSYHLDPDTGNWAQGDSVDFTITLYAEQRLGNGPDQLSNKLFLDNKTGNPDWYFMADQVWGVLDWSAGSGELYAQGLSAGTDYSLITYVDPWLGTVNVLASGTTSTDGTLSLSGITMPTGYEGKIWLVLSSDVGSGQMSGWTPTAYLFEANKVSIP